MIWDTTYDIRFVKPSPILWDKSLIYGDIIWKEIKIGPELSGPTLAEELVACRESSILLTESVAWQNAEFRRKATMKSMKSPKEIGRE